jgi:hypothetical protein
VSFNKALTLLHYRRNTSQFNVILLLCYKYQLAKAIQRNISVYFLWIILQCYQYPGYTRTLLSLMNTILLHKAINGALHISHNPLHEYCFNSAQETFVRAGYFLFSTVSRPLLELSQSPIQWERRALSLEVKRLGPEVDHSPQTSTEIKNTWISTSTPPYVFMT